MRLRQFRAALGFVLVLGAVAFAGVSAAQELSRTISVAGEGRVTAAPDVAVVQLGVTREAATAAEALEEASQATQRVLARIDAAGIASRDVQTSRLSLDPQWDHRSAEAGGQRITGYVAGNMLTVRLRDLALLGALLDATVGAGANTFGGLSFAVSDPAPLREAARRAAVADAMARAQTLADAAGVGLGAVQSIAEQGGSDPRPPAMRAEFAMDSAVPVAEGEVEITVRIAMVIGIAG